MSEPNSAPDPTPEVPKAPSYTYDAPAAAAPSNPLPPPTYGERVPDYTAAPAYGTPGYGAPVSTVKRRRTWDLVLTVILLVVGLFGMFAGVGYGLIFLSPDLLNEALNSQGYGSVTVDSRGAGALLILSHAALYLVAAVVSIILLVKRVIAFWVPLAAGVIAAIIFWVTVFSVLFTIPGLVPSSF